MTFDYKKAYKEFYLPPKAPSIITIPAMNFLAVRGQGDPNEGDSAYKQALGMLYAVAYTIKMRKHKPEGYFDYVVPPLEGLWWDEGFCVQCMHIDPYDNEPATVAAMVNYAKAQSYEEDFRKNRFHHEIYLSDMQRCRSERLKTVIRHPIKRTES